LIFDGLGVMIKEVLKLA